MNYQSVFDIPIADQFGNPNMLEQYRGKILMFVNTTGHCGNASQWPILNAIADEYRDKNIQIIYVPTNDYCGSVTVAPYKDGIKNASESFDYANNTYGITDPFTELTSSRDTPWTYKVDKFIGSTGEWVRDYDAHHTVQQLPRGELYNFLIPRTSDGMIMGNFHKIITNSQGMPVASIYNYILNNGPRHFNNIEILSGKVLLNDGDITALVTPSLPIEVLAQLEFPIDAVRHLLFNLGTETIKAFDPHLEYSLDEELLALSQTTNKNQYFAQRAAQDIVDIQTMFDLIIETDHCIGHQFAYEPY